MPTEQEQFWAGEFGDAYTERNAGALLDAKRSLFREIWARNDIGLVSVIEFGANRGLNLVVLGEMGLCELAAVEINDSAVKHLRSLPLNVFHLSMLDCAEFIYPSDLAFTMGVLIHIAPADLPRAYDALHRASKRYVLIAEYFSRQPVEIEYRGQMGKLWKRDFAAELLDRHKDLKLIDYGFVSRLDPVAPLDDIHWWLMERHA